MDQAKKLVGMLSGRQLGTILVAVLLVGGGIYGFVQWERENGFRPLYTSLAQEDAATVVQKLRESGTPYHLSGDGTTILVPEEKVAELRLDMAAAGLPKSGRIGFEIFDKTNFGVTDFAEHVNYRRALEGELERSVMAISEVEQARVHISFPQESVFIDKREPAKASVLVKLRAELPETAIPAITHLVSSAVEGLAPESVSVLDMRGNLLSRAKRSADQESDASSGALEYRHSVEQDLTTKLNSTLEPLVGTGRFRAAVSADCDMTSAEQSEENFDPTHSVMVASQKTEDVSTSGRSQVGIPGVASNSPETPPKPAGTGPGSSRKSENINYQTSRLVKRTVLPQGTIKRLSISVLLDQEVHFEGTGADAKRVLTPPTPERLKVIHDLAAAAVGFSEMRGDQLIVESLPFESTMNLDRPGTSTPTTAPAGPPLTPMEQLKKNPKMMGGAAAGVLVVVGGLIFMLKKKKSAQPATANQTEALPAGNGEAAARVAPAREPYVPSALGSAPAAAALSAPRAEVLMNQIRDTVQKDGEVYAGVLRGWLKEG